MNNKRVSCTLHTIFVVGFSNEFVICGVAQAVSMRELVEATQRTRFGVNGGQSSILSGPRSWVRRLNDSLLESVSRSSPVRATPMGQS